MTSQLAFWIQDVQPCNMGSDARVSGSPSLKLGEGFPYIEGTVGLILHYFAAKLNLAAEELSVFSDAK